MGTPQVYGETLWLIISIVWLIILIAALAPLLLL
jgi:hypothetical protein